MASITAELREYFGNCYVFRYEDVRERLTAIADRIDADHERELRETAEDIVRDVRREWVRLPLDADGVPIHFGDVLDQFGTPMTVYAMTDPDPDQENCMLELITDGISDSTWVRARKMRHYKQPKVEEVLRDYATRILIAGCIDEEDELVAEYAKKLRLAGDGE